MNKPWLTIARIWIEWVRQVRFRRVRELITVKDLIKKAETIGATGDQIKTVEQACESRQKAVAFALILSINTTLDAAKRAISGTCQYYKMLEPGQSVTIIVDDPSIPYNPFVGDLLTWRITTLSSEQLCDAYIRDHKAYHINGGHKPVLPNIPGICGVWVIRKKKQISLNGLMVQTYHINSMKNGHSIPDSHLHETGHSTLFDSVQGEENQRILEMPKNCFWLKHSTERFRCYD